jgi:hypothetical protein
MSRVGAIFWLGLAMTACVVMFMINYAVQSLQDDLNKVRKQTVAEQLEIRVLHAEWSYLTQPERLAALNQQFLSLTPIATKQLQETIADIPMRPVVADPPAEEVASTQTTPAAADRLLPAASASEQALDALFAQASGQPQPAPAALPVTKISLTMPAQPAPSQLPLDPRFAQASSQPQPAPAPARTTKAAPTAAAPRPMASGPGLDALFARVASER